MKAARIHRFGPPEVITIDELPIPTPAEGEIVVRTAFAGVGPWDAWIREKTSVVDVPLPFILGSDLSGTVDAVGAGVTTFKPGDAVYGVANKDFCGAYSEYVLASAEMMALKPKALDFAEAASAPVVAVTAWQMLFDYAQVKAGQTILIHAAGGSVGAFAVQLARRAEVRIFATAGPNDLEYVENLGASAVINYRTERFEDLVPKVDAVLDLVGGEIQRRSLEVLKPEGILVSAVSPVRDKPKIDSIRTAFFLVEVTTARLNALTRLFDEGALAAAVGTILPLDEARRAHEMLAGAPHARGKILLQLPNFG